MRGGNEPGRRRKPTDIERLVSGAAAGEEGDPRWSALLRALTAAARGAAVDPGREQAAVIAFRDATAARSARARRHGRSLWSVRALAGGLAAVFALCGVAVAAGAVLPNRGHTAHSGAPPAPVAPTTAPSSTGTAPGTLPAPVHPAPSAPSAPTASTTAASPPGHTRSTGPRSRPPTAVRAMCRVYLTALKDGRKPGPRLTARLRSEAGGRRRIAAYCRPLLMAAPGTATTSPPHP